jgi:hypothetical protein
LREDDIKEEMDLAVSLEDSLKQPLLKKGTKTLERESLKTRLNIAGDKYQTGSKITIEINRRKLTPESYGHGRTPRTTSSKRTCQAKKDQTSADQATEHFEGHFG